MLNLFSDTNTSSITITDFLICTAASLVLGFIIACVFKHKSKVSKSFVVTLALLPAIVQMVIMLVNGNLGTGVAVMGAFSLIRFRSVPGTAKDICSIFLAMAAGIATGTGNIMIAVIFTFILCGINLLYSYISFGENKISEKELQITIPESLDYSDVFNDIFEKYTSNCKLTGVKTSNMGSLYKLSYDIILKNQFEEKKMIDEIRCRNGNLEISCGRPVQNFEQL